MADSNPAGIPNNVQMFKDALAIVSDELFEQNSVTQIWAPDPNVVRGTNDAREIQIASLFMEGLGFYGGGDGTAVGHQLGTGYPTGAMTLEWNTYKLPNDRAKRFDFDKLDVAHSRDQGTVGRGYAEFIRTKVIPEVDADAINSVFKARNTMGAVGGATPVYPEGTEVAPLLTGTAITSANILGKLTEIIEGVQRASDQDMVQLMLNWDYSQALNNSTEAQKMRLVNGAGMPEIEKISNVVTAINGIPVIRVRRNRMLDTMTKGPKGFTGTSNLVALATPPGVVQRVVSDEDIKIINPEINQHVRGWSLFYATYYGTFVPKYKIPAVGALTVPAPGGG